MNRWRWALPFLFALLYWASFHPLDLGFLGWFALLPLLAYAKATSGRRSFFVAWLGGAAAFSACFFWVRHTVPIAPYLLGVYKGLYVALFVVIVRRLGPAWTPLAWTGLEYVRSHLFGGLPWFLLGTTQHDAFRLIQVADLGGVWLVSALTASAAGALAHGGKALRWSTAAAIAAAMVYGEIRPGTVEMRDGPLVAVIQPNIPQDLKNTSLQEERDAALGIYRTHLDLTLEAAKRGPDLIVWPEAAMYYGLIWDVPTQKWKETIWSGRVRAPSRLTGTPSIIGMLIGDWMGKSGVWTNSAAFIDAEGKVAGRFDKVHLVPYAEFIPLSEVLPWMREAVHAIGGQKLTNMRPGTEFPLWEVKGARFGPQICFEAIFPEISRGVARKGAEVLVNISNDGWFRDSAELDQMQAMARFRAIENRIHVIRATNTGISAFIEPTGRVQSILPGKEVRGILVERPRIAASGWSLYRAVGDWAGWGAALVALGLWIGRIFVDRVRKGP